MTGDLAVVYLGLGSNLGDRRANLVLALERLAPSVRVEAVSPLYETDPVGPQDQPSYYNAACRGVTSLSPQELLHYLKDVERDLGRREGRRWGPRLIDIDILLYGGAVVEEEGLSVPHRELPNRAFVLVPLAELAAELRHPTLGRTIGELAEDVDRSGVRRCGELGWEQS